MAFASFIEAASYAEPYVADFVEELESGIEESRLWHPPEIEQIEATSAAALGSAALVASRKRKRGKVTKGPPRKRRKRSRRHRSHADQMVTVRRMPIPLGPVHYAYGARSRYRRRRPYRRRRYSRRRKRGSTTMRATTRGSYIAKGGSSHNRTMLVKKLHRPQAIGTRGNMPVIDFDSLGFKTSEGFHYVFRLDHVPGYTNYVNVFDYYRIENVKLSFSILQNSHSGAAQSNSTNPLLAIQTGGSAASVLLTGLAPRIIFCPDETSKVNFGAENDALAHEKSRVHIFNDSKELIVNIKPVYLDEVGPTGSTANSSHGRRSFIKTDAAGRALEHYGLRGYCIGFHHSVQVIVHQETTIKFKGLKL